jgi:hypothetical protein
VLPVLIHELLAESSASVVQSFVSNSGRRRRLGLKKTGQQCIGSVLKNRRVYVPIFQQVVELLGAEIEQAVQDLSAVFVVLKSWPKASPEQ